MGGNTDAETDAIMRKCGMPLWGAVSFDAIKERLLCCGAAKRLPEDAKSVICALFPYYSGDAVYEFSRYAAPQDYHTIVMKMLGGASAGLRNIFAGNVFEPFCDSSPVPEVETARLAGLGSVGRNGLLINPEFGSFVFIGEIVTDLIIDYSKTPGSYCISCGRCRNACPSGAITENGVDKERCVSHITQKKGELTSEEAALIRRAGTVWGCDICQNVCPLNKNAEKTYLDGFKKDTLTKITVSGLERGEYSGRAFMWRGAGVLKRNLGILHGAKDNNITEKE